MQPEATEEHGSGQDILSRKDSKCSQCSLERFTFFKGLVQTSRWLLTQCGARRLLLGKKERGLLFRGRA
jgi:hypothetical protein